MTWVQFCWPVYCSVAAVLMAWLLTPPNDLPPIILIVAAILWLPFAIVAAIALACCFIIFLCREKMGLNQ